MAGIDAIAAADASSGQSLYLLEEADAAGRPLARSSLLLSTRGLLRSGHEEASFA